MVLVSTDLHIPRDRAPLVAIQMHKRFFSLAVVPSTHHNREPRVALAEEAKVAFRCHVRF
jgi:hypothetical protein